MSNFCPWWAYIIGIDKYKCQMCLKIKCMKQKLALSDFQTFFRFLVGNISCSQNSRDRLYSSNPIKNVWTSDKSWEPDHTLTHYLTLSHSHTHSISHSITLDMLNNFCFHLYAQNSPSHFLTLTLSRYLTLTLSHSHTLSISHSITLDMLNKFCFHV